MAAPLPKIIRRQFDRRAVRRAVGGMGMTDQFDIGFFMKRARVCEELFGDANFHADQLARMKSY